MQARCPVCGLPVDLPDDVIEGEVVEHDCGTSLEVRSDGNGGFRLTPLEGITEDWGE